MPTECKYKDEIKKALEQTEENKHSIKMIRGKDWYDNKTLYEMIAHLKDQFQDFNENFHKYNGLVEKYEQVWEKQQALNERIIEIEREEAKRETKEGTKEETNVAWGDWIVRAVAVISTLIAVAQFMGG